MNRWPHSDDALRAMYAGGRAGPTARRYARLWAAVFGLGLLPKRWVTLEVAGRRSGRAVRFPLGMADWDGQWYLVPMLGERCNWVQNVRAADGRATLRRGRAVACRLIEVPVSERPPVLRRYLEKVPGARPHIPVGRRAPLADFAAIAARYPVFRVVPAARAAATSPAAQPPVPASHGIAEFSLVLHRR
jgi:F420H(2)-dependent quinone reductase